MLDRIENNSADLINQSSSLDRIKEISTTNPFNKVKGNYFVDESDISSLALEKYNHEQDIKKFSDFLFETDEKEATKLVLQEVFNGKIEMDNDELISELIKNKTLINDINEH